MTIDGLRGFSEKATVEFALPSGTAGSGLTLITGPNNSGKSTIIEAVKLRSSFHQTPSFHVGMRNVAKDAVQITYTINGHTEMLSSSRAGSSETIAQRTSEFAPYVVPSRRQFSPYFGKSSATLREQYAIQAGSNQALREQTLTGFEGRLFELERSHAAFDELLAEVLPGFMDWSIDQSENGQYYVKLKSHGKTHSLSGSGDGVISTFVIVAALFDSKPGELIAIDEPELSLHPSVQRRLSTVMGRFAADRQLVVSTHSPYFIDPSALRNGASVIRTWDRDDKIEIFQLSVNSCAGLGALLKNNLNNPHVFGLDARDVFFSDDKIVVFEGQEDLLYWPKVAMSHSLLIGMPAFGWGAGGAANMINVVHVLNSLGYRKVAGVLDNNRPQDVLRLKNTYPDYLFIELPGPDIRSKPVVLARPAVIGLLDTSGAVRPEFVSSLGERLQQLEDFLTTS